MIMKEFIPKQASSTSFKKGYENEKDAAYYIDFSFKNTKNSIVLHDLNLEFEGQKAQIDHLLISRLGIYVLESKFFSGDIIIDSHGAWTVKYGDKEYSIPSPIEQNDRHIMIVEKILKKSGLFPSVLGLSMLPKIHNYILLSTQTKLPVECPKEVIKQDTLLNTIISRGESDILGAIVAISKIISSDTAIAVANKLLSFNREPVQKISKTKVKIKVPEPDVSIVEEVLEPVTVTKRTFEELKAIRTDLSKTFKVKAYYIFSDKTLQEILEKDPLNKEDMLKIHGVGEVKFEKYGKFFLR